MNYYAKAISIIVSGRPDWFSIVAKIAENHPKAVVDAVQSIDGKPIRGDVIDWAEEARTIMDQGERVEAIKYCRNNGGLSLKEAADFVDSYNKTRPLKVYDTD